MKFIITEKTDINATREGTLIEAKNLSAAKAAASRQRFFKGTCLTVEDKFGRLMAYKNYGEKNWVDVDF